jgi:drug/metabolite transporter (DMT)-like permease
MSPDASMNQPATSKSNLPAYLALAAGILCIGLSAIFVKFAGLPGSVSAFYRVLIAALVLIPWRLGVRRPLPGHRALALILWGGLFFALDLVLWNSSILLTAAATATLLANNAPLWVGLGALLLFQEKLSPRYWFGLVTALGGMAFIVGGNALRELHLNTGDLLAIGASLFYAAYLLTTQQARLGTDTLTFNAVSMFTAVVILLGINLLTGAQLVGFTQKSWLALLGLGLISQLGGWLAINYALGHLRATDVSVSLLAQVIVTALLGIPLLGEYLSFNQVFGGVLVLSGIYLVNTRSPSN